MSQLPRRSRDASLTRNGIDVDVDALVSEVKRDDPGGTGPMRLLRERCLAVVILGRERVAGESFGLIGVLNAEVFGQANSDDRGYTESVSN